MFILRAFFRQKKKIKMFHAFSDSYFFSAFTKSMYCFFCLTLKHNRKKGPYISIQVIRR